MVTHLPIGYYDRSGIPRRWSFPIVIKEFPEGERRADFDKKILYKVALVESKVAIELVDGDTCDVMVSIEPLDRMVWRTTHFF